MEESPSVRRWKLAERLQQKAQHPWVPAELRERALRSARLLKAWIMRHESRKETEILDSGKSSGSR